MVGDQLAESVKYLNKHKYMYMHIHTTKFQDINPYYQMMYFVYKSRLLEMTEYLVRAIRVQCMIRFYNSNDFQHINLYVNLTKST